MDWHAWLIDRSLHRAPVDQHFNDAIAWIAGAHGSHVFELGPGPELDLRDRVIDVPGKHWSAADTADLDRLDVANISEEWRTARKLPYGTDGWHAVLAREVFEHVDDLPAMLRELHRMLAPGGRLWFSTVFMFVLHDYESGDYWRLSPTAWEMMLRLTGFTTFEVRPERLLFGSWQCPVNILGWAEK